MTRCILPYGSSGYQSALSLAKARDGSPSKQGTAGRTGGFMIAGPLEVSAVTQSRSNQASKRNDTYGQGVLHEISAFDGLPGRAGVGHGSNNAFASCGAAAWSKPARGNRCGAFDAFKASSAPESCRLNRRSRKKVHRTARNHTSQNPLPGFGWQGSPGATGSVDGPACSIGSKSCSCRVSKPRFSKLTSDVSASFHIVLTLHG